MPHEVEVGFLNRQGRTGNRETVIPLGQALRDLNLEGAPIHRRSLGMADRHSGGSTSARSEVRYGLPIQAGLADSARSQSVRFDRPAGLRRGTYARSPRRRSPVFQSRATTRRSLRTTPTRGCFSNEAPPMGMSRTGSTVITSPIPGRGTRTKLSSGGIYRSPTNIRVPVAASCRWRTPVTSQVRRSTRTSVS